MLTHSMFVHSRQCQNWPNNVGHAFRHDEVSPALDGNRRRHRREVMASGLTRPEQDQKTDVMAGRRNWPGADSLQDVGSRCRGAGDRRA